MDLIRQLDVLVGSWPLWARVLVGVTLLIFSAISLYGRINLDFGHKAFTRIPKSEIRSNWTHIIRYTVTPIAVTAVYFYCLFTK